MIKVKSNTTSTTEGNIISETHEGAPQPTHEKTTPPNENNTQSIHNNEGETLTNNSSPEDNNITTESNSDMIARNIAYLHTKYHRSHKSKRLQETKQKSCERQPHANPS